MVTHDSVWDRTRERLNDVLDEIDDYLDQRADTDLKAGVLMPNTELHLLTKLRRARRK